MTDRSSKGKGKGKGPNRSSMPVPRRPSSDVNGAPRHHTLLTPVAREIGFGVAGSNSRSAINQQTGLADPLADMAGVIHRTLNPHGVSIIGGHGEEHPDYYYDHDFDVDMMRQSSPCLPHTPHTPHSTGHGSTIGASHESTLPFITRNGYAFGDSQVHREIMNIFWDKLDHPWPVFSKIPSELRTQMFERFRSLYRWSPKEEESIYQGFENVLKERYRDRMRDARDVAVIQAQRAGHHIEDVNESFHILENFHPEYVPENVWKTLCAYWNTPKWKNISQSAKKNRNTPDSNGKIGRHTGGSIGNADHRRKMKEATGKDPSWLDLFMKTRLDKESKKRYFEGDRSNLKFCSETARQAHDAYMRGLNEKYGDDPTKHVDDVDVWNMSQLQRQKGTHKGRMYGIGSADPQFLFTGSLSSGGGNSDYVQNEELEKLRNEVASMRESEAQREARDAQRELELEEMRRKHALLEAQMAAFFKQHNFPGNPPQEN